MTTRWTGSRLPWSQMPQRLVDQVEHWAGNRIVSAIDQAGGFSPGPATRITTASGRRFFAKAAGPELNPDTPALHRREAAISAALPPGLPAPRLLWSFDEGPEGWIVLAFEDVEGHRPSEPWREDELSRVIAAMKDMASQLSPSPLSKTFADTVGDAFRGEIHGWQLLRSRRSSRLDEWSRRHLDELAELESQAPAPLEGDSLCHMDVRADDILLTDTEVFFVDWPHARVGALWVDAVAMAPSVALEGGPAPEGFLARYGTDGVEPRAVNAVIASLAGYFIEHSLRAPPAGIPNVRGFQAAQGRVAVDWLRKRTTWA